MHCQPCVCIKFVRKVYDVMLKYLFTSYDFSASITHVSKQIKNFHRLKKIMKEQDMLSPNNFS